MTPVEIALLILVLIWSLIFVVLAIGLIIILYQVKKAVDKVNRILQNAEDVTEGIASPLKMAASGISAFLKNRSRSHKHEISAPKK